MGLSLIGLGITFFSIYRMAVGKVEKKGAS